MAYTPFSDDWRVLHDDYLPLEADLHRRAIYGILLRSDS